MTFPRSIPPALAAAAILAAAAPRAVAQDGPSPANVALDEARLEVVQQWREVTGDLRAIRRSTLAAEAQGLVMELLIDAGDAVEAGEPIARLKDTLATYTVDSAEATLQQRRATVALHQAELAKAERDLTQTQELASRGGARQTEVADAETIVDTARARLAEAEAEVASAEALLAEARERLANTVITAPFDGFIVGEHTEVGQWVQEGDPIAEIVQTDVIEAWLDVPERFIVAISSADSSVQLRIEALGEVLEAQVTAIVPLADALSRLFPVRVRLENPDGLLRPGMSVTGLVPTGQSVKSLTVHKDGILRNDAGTYVYFAQEAPAGGSVSAVAPVQILFASGNRVAVRSPVLSGGEQIVIEGNERMLPGQPLKVVNGGDAAGAGGETTGAKAPEPTEPSAPKNKGD